MRFEFATATQIIFGAGALRDIGSQAAALGSRALVVTGSSPERAASLLKALDENNIEHQIFSVVSEPSIEMASQGVKIALETDCDLVISLGGGSVLDAGKAIAALATNPGDPLDYLEVIGKGQPLIHPPLPFIAIPTTAGTGAEVTRNAVLASPEQRVKVSLRSPMMLPRLALVDPELTYALPPEITASTGMDALTQALEPFVSVSANPITDAFCREGLRRAARALRTAYENGEDVQAREDMALASLLGGLALANAKLGAVHGFAGVLGGMFDAPHGAVCAVLLPYVMAINVRALQGRDPQPDKLNQYDEIARILTGQEEAEAADGVDWVYALCEDLHIPKLGQYGVTRQDISEIVEKSAQVSSMKGNPVKLSPEEMAEILERAL